MKKIVAFGASSSKTSINKKFASHTAGMLENCAINILDLNDFETEIYSVDKEAESGIPKIIHSFIDRINEADGIIISFAEHNGSYTAAFKNIYDWCSRVDGQIIKNKPALFLATSPGARGGMSVLDAAKARFGYQNENLIATFSLPSFYDNFSDSDGVLNDHKQPHAQTVLKFQAVLDEA